MSGVRVVVADDAVLIRESVSLMLQDAGLEVVGSAGDAEAARDVVLGAVPDVVVMDIRMPPNQGRDGIRAAREIWEQLPDMPVLFLSQHVDTVEMFSLLRARTSRVGYLLKERVAGRAEFVEAVQHVAAGGQVIDRSLVASLMEGTDDDPLVQLTDREREVLAALAEGLSNGAIARRLFLSERTVEYYIRQVFAALDIADESDSNRRVLAVLRYFAASGGRLADTSLM